MIDEASTVSGCKLFHIESSTGRKEAEFICVNSSELQGKLI